MKLQNLMVAVDGSDASNRAIDVAAELAKNANGTLTIVSAAAPLSSDQLAALRRQEGAAPDATDILAQETLREAEKRAGWSGLPRTSIKGIFRWDDPAQMIIDCIVSEKVDAIVVGRRGRGRLGGLLLGSVSQKLATLSPCPVIIVP
jgi:nucleotide-binding universal stress UspA family protein